RRACAPWTGRSHPWPTTEVTLRSLGVPVERRVERVEWVEWVERAQRVEWVQGPVGPVGSVGSAPLDSEAVEDVLLSD
ncbi:CSD domain-containing protein, partial [Durusdinium trenchii]